MTASSRPDEKIYYVYALLDTRKPGTYKYGRYSFPYEPFYVGKGKGARVRAHHQRGNQAIQNKINKIKQTTGGHKARIIKDGLDEASAYDLEVKVIARIGRKFDHDNKGPLLNYNNGGRGKQQNFVSEETRKRRAKSLKKYWAKTRADKKAYAERTKNMGPTWSEETRLKVSEAKKEFYASEAGQKARKKLSKAVRKAAASMSPEKKKAIYEKQQRTRRRNARLKQS